MRTYEPLMSAGRNFFEGGNAPLETAPSEACKSIELKGKGNCRAIIIVSFRGLFMSHALTEHALLSVSASVSVSVSLSSSRRQGKSSTVRASSGN